VRVPEDPTLLVFLRGHWCEYCQAQLSELAREAAGFHDHGIRIVALSTDDAATCCAFASDIGDAFPILSDPNAVLVRRLGLLDPAPDLPGLTSYPAVFLIDAAGRVQFFYVGRTPADRPSCELLLLAAERLSAEGEPVS
jgi:peroxiredoxin